MRVVYEKTITEQIREEISSAEKQGRRIDRIVLTWEEMLRLGKEISLLPTFSRNANAWIPVVPTHVCGVKVSLE